MSLRGFDRKFYMSAKTYQSAIATAELEAAMCPFRLDSEAFQVVPEYTSDIDLIGGSEEATSQQELARSVTGTISQNRVQPHLLAAIGSFAMARTGGSGVTSTLLETGAYSHVIPAQTTDFTLGAFTALDLFTSTYYVEYIGCMVNSFTLSAARKGWLALSADIIGSGNIDTSITVGSLGTAVTETYLKAGDCKVFLKASPTGTVLGTRTQAAEDLPATPTTITTKIESFNWSYNNNLAIDSLYEFGSGIYMGRSERDRRSQTLSFAVEFEDTTYFTYLTDQTELALEFDFISATLAGATKYYGAQIIFPSVKLTSFTVSGGTGKLIGSCECLVMENDVSTPDATAELTVWNAQTSYLTT